MSVVFFIVDFICIIIFLTSSKFFFFSESLIYTYVSSFSSSSPLSFSFSGSLSSSVVASSSSSTFQPTKSPQWNPIVFIPGVAGSGLLARLSNVSIPYCAKNLNSTEYRIWASLHLLMPPFSHQMCWLNTMKINYDENTGIYEDLKGVNISVDSFGSTRGFDYLDYMHGYGVVGTKYMHSLLKALKTFGYTDGNNMYGLPYDWRYPPWQIDLKKFIQFIEQVKNKHNKKIVLIAHSLGTMLVTYILNKYVSDKWKEDNIEMFVSVGGVYGGSFKVIKGIISGYNDPVRVDFFNIIDISPISADFLKMLEITLGSVYALQPNPNLYGADRVVIRVKMKNKKKRKESSNIFWIFYEYLKKKQFYFIDSFLNFFNKKDKLKQLYDNSYFSVLYDNLVNKTSGIFYADYDIREKKVNNANIQEKEEIVYTLKNWTECLQDKVLKKKILQASSEIHPYILQDPNVPVICIWSVFDKPSTDVEYIYEDEFKKYPISILDKGDDTVPLESLSYCTKWKSCVKSYSFKNTDHMRIFDNVNFIQTIIKILTGSKIKESEIKNILTKDSEALKIDVDKVANEENSDMYKTRKINKTFNQIKNFDHNYGKKEDVQDNENKNKKSETKRHSSIKHTTKIRNAEIPNMHDNINTTSFINAYEDNNNKFLYEF